MSDAYRDCKHGQLARQCPHCENETMESEIETLRAQVAALEARLREAGEQVPVAYMHNKRADVIHTSVKSLLSDFAVNSGPESMLRPIDKSEHYTIPLYAAPVPAQPAAVPELVRYCCSCQSVGEVDPRSVSCCPDAPGSVGYVSARFASRLAREFNVVRNGSAAVPEAVAKDAIPAGWVFYSADASIQSSDPRRPMAAMIKRDVDGVQWWLQLTEEEKEATPLYSSGAGMTLTLAIQNAVAAILSAADTEVKK